jgi:15-cis-phytoene synthase
MQENLKLSEQRPLAAGAGRGLREAQRCCEQIARREAKNFYWGFISLPHDQRMAIYALYDFARQVDDEADVRVGPNLHERLNYHRRCVSNCVRGEYCDAVTHVLAAAIARYRIPESELQELIDGVEMDSYRTRYASWDELRVSCRLVASIVGRMCVRIFGYSDPTALVRADDLGLALQITNILRDIREDAERDRLYLPADELARFDISESGLLGGAPGDGWPALVALQVQRARGFYASGLRVVEYIPGRAAVCVSTMAGIYERILDKIESDPWLPLRARTSLSHIEKLHVMVGSWLRVG